MNMREFFVCTLHHHSLEEEPSPPHPLLAFNISWPHTYSNTKYQSPNRAGNEHELPPATVTMTIA
jgi:hypothetical protein